MDKQKLTTFEAVERICRAAGVQPADVSYCGLKDKQGRTTQLVAVRRKPVELQEPDLRLKPLGRTATALSAANTTSNRFAVTVRDLSEEDVAKLPTSVAEVQRLGVVNYFDSQRFGPLKHGQGFLVKDLMRGDAEAALKNHLARPSELDRTHDAKVKAFWRDHWGDWQLKNLRSQFAMVSQDVVMLNDTLAANVALGAELDRERVLACMEAANLAVDVLGGVHLEAVAPAAQHDGVAFALPAN